MTDKLRDLLAPTTAEEAARERMRVYEAEPTPGFVPAENEVLERELAEKAGEGPV